MSFLEEERYLHTVIEILTKMPEAIPALAATAIHPNAYIRMISVKILGGMLNEKTRNILVNAQKDAEPPVSDEAYSAVRALDDKKR